MKLQQLRPPARSKIGPVSTTRDTASVPAPASRTGQGENKSQVSTYFTKIPVVGQDPEVLYNGDRMWARVILTLETAGPVAVGQSSQLQPVLSGKGQLLETGVPTPFTIAKGNRLYIAATGVNRVKVVVEPFPWLEQLTGLLNVIMGSGAPVPPPDPTSKL